MSSPGRLQDGMPRVYEDHRRGVGREYRNLYRAIARDLGPFEPGSLLAQQAALVALSWLDVVATTRALAQAREKRETDRGRRPSAREIDRLQHRHQVASRDYSDALSALREAVKARPPKPFAQVLAERRAQKAQERPQ